MRAVLDANIIVSAANGFEAPLSPLAILLRAGIHGQYMLLTSEHIIGEVRFALGKPFFRARLAPEVVEAVLEELEQKAERVEITRSVKGVATHWQDDIVLATALSGDADVLVTGDRELLDLQHPFPFSIMTPGDFLALLEPGSPAE